MDGRFGQGLKLLDGQSVVYAGDNGNLPAGPGTVEFWLRPAWAGNDGEVRYVLSSSGAQGNYLAFNKLKTGRFGGAIANQPEGAEIQYARADTDVSGWQPGEWHHVALTWDTKLTLWLDGEAVETKETAPWPQILPERLILRGGEQVIDELRISSVVRYGEEAPTMAAPAGVTWLSEIEPVEFEGYAKLGHDVRYTTAGEPQLLSGGGHYYAKGVGMHAPSRAVYALDGKFARLQATLALSDFASRGGSVIFRVEADGEELFLSPLVTHATDPITLDVDLMGRRQLVLEVQSGPDGVGGDHGNWLDAALLTPGAAAVSTSRGAPTGVTAEEEAKPELVEPEGVYQTGFPIQAGASGFELLPTNYLDEFDPQQRPTGGDAIALRAAQGETEPATLLVLASREQPGTTVTVSDLTGPGTIPAAAVTIRRAVRAPRRKIYTSAPDQLDIVARFLPRWEPQDIPAGEFREAWLSLDVPADAPGGEYTGTVTVTSGDRTASLPLRLRVDPFTLDVSETNQLGSYYRMNASLIDEDMIRRELEVMQAHGLRNLVTDLGIGWRREGDRLVADLTGVRRGLGLIRDSGMRGTVIVHDALTTLAALCGFQRDGDPAALETNAEFMAAAKEGIEAFVALEQEFPELKLALTHLDEVFNRDRLPLYIALAKAVRQVPEATLYVTFHTVNEEADAMRREVDPYVDIRCNHGYSFELWLARGHTMKEYQEELDASGDVAWIYHNDRGTWFTPEWTRIINGLYLWASPFIVHVPWTWQSWQGNPYDDTDGGDRAHDFGLTFPSLTDDRLDLVPTRSFEAMREGNDDLRYLATLERLVLQQSAARPDLAANGRALLTRLRGLVRDVQTKPAADGAVPETEAAKGAEVDLDTGLVMGTGTIGTADEAPLINALAKRFTGEQWQAIRGEIVDAILALQ